MRWHAQEEYSFWHSVRLRSGYRRQSLTLDAPLCCRGLMLPQLLTRSTIGTDPSCPSVCLTREKIATGPAEKALLSYGWFPIQKDSSYFSTTHCICYFFHIIFIPCQLILLFICIFRLTSRVTLYSYTSTHNLKSKQDADVEEAYVIRFNLE